MCLTLYQPPYCMQSLSRIPAPFYLDSQVMFVPFVSPSYITSNRATESTRNFSYHHQKLFPPRSSQPSTLHPNPSSNHHCWSSSNHHHYSNHHHRSHSNSSSRVVVGDKRVFFIHNPKLYYLSTTLPASNYPPRVKAPRQHQAAMALDELTQRKLSKRQEGRESKYPHYPMMRRNAIKGLRSRTPYTAEKRRSWAWRAKYATRGDAVEPREVGLSTVSAATGYEFSWPMSTNKSAEYVALDPPDPESKIDEHPYRELAPEIPVKGANNGVIDLTTDSSATESSNVDTSVTAASGPSTDITTPSNASVNHADGANFAGVNSYVAPSNAGGDTAGAADLAMPDFEFDATNFDFDNIPLYPLVTEQEATDTTILDKQSMPQRSFASSPAMPYANAGVMPPFPPFPPGNFPGMPPGMPPMPPMPPMSPFPAGSFPAMPGMPPQFNYPPSSAPVSPPTNPMYNMPVNMTPVAQAGMPAMPPQFTFPPGNAPASVQTTPPRDSTDLDAAVEAAVQMYTTLDPSMPVAQATAKAFKMVMSTMAKVQTPNQSPQMNHNANTPPKNQFPNPMGQGNGHMYSMPPSNNVSPHMYPAANFNGQMNNGSSPFMGQSNGVAASGYPAPPFNGLYTFPNSLTCTNATAGPVYPNATFNGQVNTGSPNGLSYFTMLLTSTDSIAGSNYGNAVVNGQVNMQMPFAPAGNFAGPMNPAHVYGGSGNAPGHFAPGNNGNAAVYPGRAVNGHANVPIPSALTQSPKNRHATHTRSHSTMASPVRSNNSHPAVARPSHSRTQSSPSINRHMADRVQSPRSTMAAKPVRVTKPPVNKHIRSTIHYGPNSSPDQFKEQAQAQAQARAKAQSQMTAAARQLDSQTIGQKVYNPTPINKPNGGRHVTSVTLPNFGQINAAFPQMNASHNGRTLGHMNVAEPSTTNRHVNIAQNVATAAQTFARQNTTTVPNPNVGPQATNVAPLSMSQNNPGVMQSNGAR